MILWSFGYDLTLTAVYIFRPRSFFCDNASQRGWRGGKGDLLSFCPNLDPINIKIQPNVSICSYVKLSPLKALVIESSELCRK